MPIIRSSRLYVWKMDAAVSLFLDAHPAALHLNPHKQQPSTANHRRQIHTYNRELLTMGIEVPETCWEYLKCNKEHTVTSSWFFFSAHMQRCTDKHKSRSQSAVYTLQLIFFHPILQRRTFLQVLHSNPLRIHWSQYISHIQTNSHGKTVSYIFLSELNV